MVYTGEFCMGSRLLTPLSDFFGLPIDQINFIVCQLVALLLGIPFRRVLSPRKTSTTVRHLVEVLVGVALTVFCFGYQVWHIVAQSAVTYIILLVAPAMLAHKIVFVFAMGYLSCMHIYRQYYDYGGYTMDITGPLMISSQKLTSLAFNLYDGRYRDDKDLSKSQRQYAVKSMPSLLHFTSYMFYFHGIIIGPLAFYADYMHFINGDWYREWEVDGRIVQKPLENVPSPRVAVTKKLIGACVCAVILLTMPKIIPPQKMLEPDFMENTSFLWKVLYMTVAVSFVREKYYFAWVLTEAVNNSAGLGFNGFDEKGEAKYDLLENVNIYGVETAGSQKDIIDNWNKTSTIWLRHTVYDRVPRMRTMSVFAVSALWHGFYPGYYVTFATGAMFTITARLVRRNIRPLFIKANLHPLYNVITTIFARVTNSYGALPFVYLEFMPGIKVYLSVYCWAHVCCLLIILRYSLFASPHKSKTDSHHRSVQQTSTATTETTTTTPTTPPSDGSKEKEL
ncbi:Hypothetical predicted protein [Octopus vulgaris]|uniref:Lysophospholipid acyltransferase 1 n=2 Tax=Octopus vulgaris TaxID=6645 RepID=A0AA36BU86_OCTVU|nr:Hypothetical predicted protein [Octopus vulgaris]